MSKLDNILWNMNDDTGLNSDDAALVAKAGGAIKALMLELIGEDEWDVGGDYEFQLGLNELRRELREKVNAL